MPLTPLQSVSAVPSGMFIAIDAFCIRCMALPACSTKPPRCRHKVRAVRISPLGWKPLFNNPKGVQLQQPLTFRYVALAPGWILGMPRIDR
jgi:hypothetical protein